jgi:phosphotransferase system enzyme I (PtsP)
VPSLLFQLDELMGLVDFVSIGSNDLFQFFTATDRGNARIASRFDPLSVPFFLALKQILDAGARHGVSVTLCGELAGKPLSAMALIGLGFRSISMTPSAIGPVKAMIVAVDLVRLEEAMAEILKAGSRPGSSVRERLEAFAESNGIPL